MLLPFRLGKLNKMNIDRYIERFHLFGVRRSRFVFKYPGNSNINAP